MEIFFNKPVFKGNELKYIEKVLTSRLVSGDGDFTKRCHEWFVKQTSCRSALLTTSCTHALDMTAILIGIQPGDEVILPSYTFSSTANAFVLQGARVVFVDIREDTLNLDEKLIEEAITDKTRAIIPVHYAGVSCEMDAILKIADKHRLFVIEDAAQGMLATYHDRALGSIGDFGCYSFHESKNYTCGEGGVLLLNNNKFIKNAEILREKGTNRTEFFRGEVDKYSWMDMGSSYLPSEILAAVLLAQLERAEELTAKRLAAWERYHDMLAPLEEQGLLQRPRIPKHCRHNAHIYYILLPDKKRRDSLAALLRKEKINALTHYVPLHSAPAGKKYGRIASELNVTDNVAGRILRLPMHAALTVNEQETVVTNIKKFQ